MKRLILIPGTLILGSLCFVAALASTGSATLVGAVTTPTATATVAPPPNNVHAPYGICNGYDGFSVSNCGNSGAPIHGDH